jgi:uncharacterized protein (DUF849 family)
MTTPCIITVAITGSLPQKSDNPAVPITVAEQVESTHAAFEAGATLVHAHVRNDDGTPSSSPERFARLMEGVRRHCPGMIVQLSTGGRSGTGRERGGMIPLKPEMCSLSTGSCNFPTRIQFVMGVKNAMPADRAAFEFFVATLKRLAPDATWTGAGIGRDQITLNRWSLELGGHCRTGLEDNVRLDRTTLAPSNAALVARIADIAGEYGRRPATVAEARAILGLPAVA